uniref:Uncharacterized protein n=1 Tax=Ditylenchus dipsaci TaxID=166011 RepID=A0A915DK61_9BILA
MPLLQRHTHPFYSPVVTVVPKERCASSLSNSMRHFFQCSSPSQGKLQELLVTTIRHEEQEEEEDSSHSSRQFSRASSSQSLMDDGAGSQDEAECNSLNQSDIVFDV